MITPGRGERDKRWQDQGGVHQELPGQSQDQRHRSDQGHKAKNKTKRQSQDQYCPPDQQSLNALFAGKP